MSDGAVVYCLDTSALIDAYVRWYPTAAFPTLWTRVDELIDAKRFVAPTEVWDELKNRGDALTDWAKERPHIFLASLQYEHVFLSQVAVRYPELWRNLGVAPWADPFVVALAKIRRYTVVHQEKGVAESIPKIPQMCNEYGVPQMRFVDVILAERWVFS